VYGTGTGTAVLAGNHLYTLDGTLKK